MNDSHQSFEADLQRLKPAAPPPEFMAALERVRQSVVVPAPRPRTLRIAAWMDKSRFRWLVASAAAVVIVLGIWLRHSVPATNPGSKPIASSPLRPAREANQVEIDRHLISAFDAVATLPSGEPIRLRCREWMDEIVLRDPTRGLVIERQAPRLEVIPVRFETY